MTIERENQRMRPQQLAVFVLLVAGCHVLRAEDNTRSPPEMCQACCQQAQEACKLDGQNPGFDCQRDYQACSYACGLNDKNQICVTQTSPKIVAEAPSPLPTAPTVPVVGVTQSPPPKLGECDSQGSWKLIIADATGHGAGCHGLEDLPRQINFRIHRKADEYVLMDLIPAPGWSDGFTVTNRSDTCVVTLTRDNQVDEEHRRIISVALNESARKVTGTFHYSEEGQKPEACALDAPVTGVLIAPPKPPAPMTPEPPLPKAWHPRFSH